MAVLASLGQWCMTRAYSHGATLLVANLQYSGIVFGALYSLLLFGTTFRGRAGPAWASSARAASPPPCCAPAPHPTRRPKSADSRHNGNHVHDADLPRTAAGPAGGQGP